MIKVLNQYFPGRLLVLLVTENLLIMLIWGAVAIQYGIWDGRTYPALIWRAMAATAICQLCLYYADGYDLRSLGSRGEVFFRLIQALGAATLLLAISLPFIPDIGQNERVVEVSILASTVALLIWRLALDGLTRAYGVSKKILLVGSSEAIRKLAREVRGRPDLPFDILGVVAENEARPTIPGLSQLGLLTALESIIEQSRPDMLIIGLQERRQVLPTKMLVRKRTEGLRIEEASTLYQKVTGKIPVESISPSALIFSDGFVQSPFRAVYSRLLSIVGATVGLILFGPLMLLVSLAIKLDSKGPVLYGQTRVGKHGQLFEILKFRTMFVDAETRSGPVWAQETDPRITRVGRVIRKLRVDELPQFLNLLYGHMKFVGPRPERPHFVAHLAEQIPYYDLRHTVRPGLTGWAQVQYNYGNTLEDAHIKLQYDFYYLRHWSLWLDLHIILQTIGVVLKFKGT